jgi:hypothetical protein
MMEVLRRPAAEERDDHEKKAVRPGPKRIEEPREASPERRPPRRALIAWTLVAALLLILAIVAQHFDEYLRRTIEAKVNQRLQGYTVSLAGAHLNPFGLALTLRGAVIRQQAHPEPAVADIPRLEASVEWKELLHLHLVANALFDQPRIHVNLPQLREEDRDQVKVQDRGWQDALQAIYPLKFNLVQVRDGQITYVDQDPKRPLEVTHWNLSAENIRNVRSNPGVYPSPIHTDGVLFGQGRAVLDGHADFLSKPYPGFHFVYEAEKVPLERLGVLSSRANMEISGGTLRSKGEVEYSPVHREARIADVTVGGLRLDYVHSAVTAPAEKARAQEASQAIQDDQPAMLVRLERFELVDSVLGLVDRAKDHPFRVYVDDTDLVVTNLSSGFRQGPAKAKLDGRFMGSGTAHGTATFREAKNGPDFDFNISVVGASLPALNDLLRAYGRLDVAAGTFSVYSEIKVHDGRIDGYVKPLIKDVKVYDPKQDKNKPVLKKIYEKVVGGLSHILKNQPREEVATVADISGPLGDPNTSIWDIAVRVLSNAFVKAILPGFDREFDTARER